MASLLGFTAHFSLIFWSEEKEETARSLTFFEVGVNKNFSVLFGLRLGAVLSTGNPYSVCV